jgi:opacity protein-like surface antigen
VINRFPTIRLFAVSTMMLTVSAGATQAQTPTPIAQSTPAQGPMSVERLHNGWAVAPDFKVTQFDDGTHSLAGVYGGYVIDKQLLIGGAGYWLTDPNRTRKLSYGGALVEWREGVDRELGFAVKGLLGFGTATATTNVSLRPRFPFDNDVNQRTTVPTPLIANVAFREDFFVAEPQADLLIGVGRHALLHIGGGYRAVGGARGLEDSIRGATGSVAFEIGSSSRR